MEKKSARKNVHTSTSSFGTPGRISHDSSKYYGSRLYDGLDAGGKIDYLENPIPARYTNRVFCKTSEKMKELPASSVHLMVTSPPYNVGKDYDSDLSMEEYLGLLKRVFAETYRVLVPGGRACINVANLGRKPYIPLNSYLNEIMREAGFLMRGEILWDKGSSASPSTAWGTFMKAGNPVLRDVHEYILVFCKQSFSRPNPEKRESTIAREEFLEYTKSVWRFAAERAGPVGHPAPFPVELPYRLVQLYTFAGEVVLDPFAGSGTTCLAALKSGRRYVAYDIEPEYCRLTKGRIKAWFEGNGRSR
ncbi:MAG: site-specific DNA-methyltransferase [Dehalococcoidia bacterium]|nr:site-specific DNA-methyltransferase [Dehalococcoidia bacterium]